MLKAERRGQLAAGDPGRSTRESGTSFYYSFLLLPRSKREAICSVYAFCRAVDDAVDEAKNPGEAARQLDRWEEVVDGCYRGAAQGTPGEALGATIERYAIPRQHFRDLLAGVRMDLTRKRYATFEELLPYSERVAGAVGLMCIRIFGLEGPEAEAYARNLGTALQLINIARDVGNDARRGRIYLPLADLDRFGVTEEEIIGEVYSPGFAALMAYHAGRARSYLSRADAAVFKERRHLAFPAEAMGAIYRALLDAIEEVQYNVFARRITVSPGRRLAIVIRSWLAAQSRRALSSLRPAGGEF